MSLAKMLRRFVTPRQKENIFVKEIIARADVLSRLATAHLYSHAAGLKGTTPELVEVFAATVAVADRILGQRMFPVQILGALAMQQGSIAEMQTGEGKTLAAVPVVVWHALQNRSVHVLTANDYLARRDAAWMGEIYRSFGLSVGFISQQATPDERRSAYAYNVTYATANEIGFDYLRDGLATSPDELVGLRFSVVVVDEADSILIDEARIPLVIAGGTDNDVFRARHADLVVRDLRPFHHFVCDENARNVRLTDSGIAYVERCLRCGNLFQPRNLPTLTAIQDALHAHALLRRDIDYVVRHNAVELVDEFKGRIAQNRRWPAGLQCAIEAKEQLAINPQGRILGSITVQSLIGLYRQVCGMTGTAATQADEFWKMYKLPVSVIPPNRPVIREDLPDVVFPTRHDRERAVINEIKKARAARRPILIGTASVAESEHLSAALRSEDIPHSVLNARNDEAEAEIIAQAGNLDAVSISTNMAGRGTDILLGGNPSINREQVVALGGLYVLGTTRHEARRIDNQLRGRAGRQGDPGTSRFLLSLEDDLLVRFGIQQNSDIDSVQRTIESQNLEAREMLWKYESVLEKHRREFAAIRREVVFGTFPPGVFADSLDRLADLTTFAGPTAIEQLQRELLLAVMDDLWADYLANIAELKGGIHWVSWGGRDPLHTFLTAAEDIYADLQARLPEEIAMALRDARVQDGQIDVPALTTLNRGATWTYLTTDQPFGTFQERIAKRVKSLIQSYLPSRTS